MDRDQIFALADEQYDLGNFENAFSLFADAAGLGDASAMSRLACMYAAGEGTQQDYEKSIEWDLRAIDLGEDASILNIGITYRDLEDINAARIWFEKSLASGDGDAALELGKLFAAHYKDTENAEHYFRIATCHDSISEVSREQAVALLGETGSVLKKGSD